MIPTKLPGVVSSSTRSPLALVLINCIQCSWSSFNYKFYRHFFRNSNHLCNVHGFPSWIVGKSVQKEKWHLLDWGYVKVQPSCSVNINKTKKHLHVHVLVLPPVCVGHIIALRFGSCLFSYIHQDPLGYPGQFHEISHHAFTVRGHSLSKCLLIQNSPYTDSCVESTKAYYHCTEIWSVPFQFHYIQCLVCMHNAICLTRYVSGHTSSGVVLFVLVERLL